MSDQTLEVVVEDAAPIAVTVDVASPPIAVSVSASAQPLNILTSSASSVNVTVGIAGDRGPKGDDGPSAALAIGTVQAGETAAATVTGSAPNQVLNLTLPKGDKGDKGDAGTAGSPANVTIGTVTTAGAGTSAGATITGTAPNKVLNLTIPRGATGIQGPPVSLSVGTVVTGAPGDDAAASISGTGASQTLNLTIPRGATGNTGKSVELQLDSGWVQWRLVGDPSWANLVEVADLAGPQGNAGADGPSVELQVADGYIQWRVVGGESWANLTDLASITGPHGDPGPSVEIQFDAASGYIQYRVAGAASWINVVYAGNAARVGVRSLTASGNVSLTVPDYYYQLILPPASGIDVTLPNADGAQDVDFFIANTSTDATNLPVMDIKSPGSGGGTVKTLAIQQTCRLVCTGSAWIVIEAGTLP